MNTVVTPTTRTVRPGAVIAIAVALAPTLAAIGTLAMLSDTTADGIFAWLGDYLTKVGEALGNG